MNVSWKNSHPVVYVSIKSNEKGLYRPYFFIEEGRGRVLNLQPS
nr:hypothetical protein KV8917_930030 [Klebsiella variicola]